MGVEWAFLRKWGLHCRNKESGTGLLQPVEIFPTYNAGRKLKDGTDFREVTMAYEDRQQMGAHKVILSPSSP